MSSNRIKASRNDKGKIAYMGYKNGSEVIIKSIYPYAKGYRCLVEYNDKVRKGRRTISPLSKLWIEEQK